jgi:hypothetical protein
MSPVNYNIALSAAVRLLETVETSALMSRNPRR